MPSSESLFPKRLVRTDEDIESAEASYETLATRASESPRVPWTVSTPSIYLHNASPDYGGLCLLWMKDVHVSQL